MRTSKETFLPSKSRCHSFYILGVTRGAESPPPGRGRPKKAGLKHVLPVPHDFTFKGISAEKEF